MRSIKRTTVIALMTVMLTGISMLEGCPTMNVQAQENSNNIVENFNENNNAVAVLTNPENGDKYICNANITNKVRKIDNESDDTYVAESEVEVTLPKEGSSNITLLSDDFFSGQEYDGSKSWKAYIKTTYKRSGDKYLVTKVNGNWKCYDSSVKISDREVTYACGHKYVRIKKTTSNTFSYSTGFTKYTKVNYFDRAGSNSHCYLKRGTGKKWGLEVLANITT